MRWQHEGSFNCSFFCNCLLSLSALRCLLSSVIFAKKQIQSLQPCTGHVCTNNSPNGKRQICNWYKQKKLKMKWISLFWILEYKMIGRPMDQICPAGPEYRCFKASVRSSEAVLPWLLADYYGLNDWCRAVDFRLELCLRSCRTDTHDYNHQSSPQVLANWAFSCCTSAGVPLRTQGRY